jgi:hypothetical protein
VRNLQGEGRESRGSVTSSWCGYLSRDDRRLKRVTMISKSSRTANSPSLHIMLTKICSHLTARNPVLTHPHLSRLCSFSIILPSTANYSSNTSSSMSTATMKHLRSISPSLTKPLKTNPSPRQRRNHLPTLAIVEIGETKKGYYITVPSSKSTLSTSRRR